MWEDVDVARLQILMAQYRRTNIELKRELVVLKDETTRCYEEFRVQIQGLEEKLKAALSKPTKKSKPVEDTIEVVGE